MQAVLQLPEGFTPTCMAHPDTYLNKVLVGSQEGKLQLWNFSSSKLMLDQGQCNALLPPQHLMWSALVCLEGECQKLTDMHAHAYRDIGCLRSMVLG